MGRPPCDYCVDGFKDDEDCYEDEPNMQCGDFRCRYCPDLKKEIITLKEDYEALKTAERIFIRKCEEKDKEIKKLKYYERIRQPDAKDARIKQLEKVEFDLECEILDKNEEIRQFKEQIEQMKNCGNCKFEPESGRVCEWKHYIEGKKRCNTRECWELKT